MKSLLILVLIYATTAALGQNKSKSKGEYLKNYLTFPLGVSVNPTLLQSNSDYRRLCETEITGITPENHMKMAHIHPEADHFNYTKADEIVNFALDRKIRIHGHALVWHESVPAWVKDFKGDTKAWEELLKNHIMSVVKYYKGKVTGWDVVNEAFNNDGTLRKTIWSDNIPDYLAKSFLWAREADPEVLLFYNDYSQDVHPAKFKAILDMVTDFQKRNIPINGIGLQMHIGISTKPENIEHIISKSAETKLKVHVSELDVAVNPKNDTAFVYSEAVQSQQAKIFETVFKSYQTLPKNQQYGITTWNVSDQDTWLRKYYKRPKEYPLLFDENYRRKPVYYQLISLMKEDRK